MTILQKYYTYITVVLNVLTFSKINIKYKYIGNNMSRKVKKEKNMSSCLGLYIEEHLIKYAKVSKEKDIIKVESFGVKFYDKINEAISQIIKETYSQKTPISINISEEMYNDFDMFALLTKSDLQKAIRTEFESYCTEKDYNPNAFETRYAITENTEDKQKIKIIHIAENKIELNKRIQEIEGYRLVNASPISISIPNLIKAEEHNNCIIVNIENKTTITTIINNKIYNIDTLDEGAGDFLSKINLRENSYAKAYEICKNTTIYTSEGRELQNEETSYLSDIMPTLFTIAEKVKSIMEEYTDKFQKVYITGTGSLINNVDLYFQEYLTETTCEILRPYFVVQTKDLSIKDYIEVNSAISIALMGVGEGISGMNFKKKSVLDDLQNVLKIDVGESKKGKKDHSGLLTWDLNEKLDAIEKNLLRGASGLLILIIIYTAFSSLLNNQITKKQQEANNSINDTKAQISLANQDNEKIKTKLNEYTTLIKNIEEENNKQSERNKTRNAIPNLLNQIMSIVPENVQLTSIENTTGTHVVIDAQSNKYEQLGYLKAKIKTDVILTNVVSTAGQKDNNTVTVRIEGDLP